MEKFKILRWFLFMIGAIGIITMYESNSKDLLLFAICCILMLPDLFSQAFNFTNDLVWGRYIVIVRFFISYFIFIFFSHPIREQFPFIVAEILMPAPIFIVAFSGTLYFSRKYKKERAEAEEGHV